MPDWAELRRLHGQLVFATAYRILKRHDQALDCLQEVFLDAFKDHAQREIHNWPGLLRWLAVKRALDQRRKEKRIAAKMEGGIGNHEMISAQSHPSEELEWADLMEQIRDEVARLPPLQAQAFWMNCVEQQSIIEIAGRLGVEPNHIGVLVHRAKARLQRTLAYLNPAKTSS